jgi:hypothetical protein
MQKQPELIGLEAMTGGAIRFQVAFVILDLIFRLAASTVNFDSLVICVTRVFSRISLIFKRIVNIPRGQAGYVGTGDLDSKYRSSAA